MKKIYLLLFLVVLLPTNVKAFKCSNEDSVKYQALAQNINYTYDYVEENNSVYFNITLVNLNSELYIYDVYNNNTYNYTQSEILLSNYKPGNVYKFKVYPTNNDCKDILKTIYISIPYYNYYYSDPLCDGLDSYKYCQKWSNVTIDYDKFVSLVTSYKESIISDNDIIETKEYKTILDYFIEYYLTYYYIGLPIIILSSLIYIIIKNKNDRLF